MGWRAKAVGMLGAWLLTVAATQPAMAEYVLVPGDEIQVEVYLDPDMTRPVIIRPDGKIAFPYLGEFEAAGLTIAQLDDFISKKLGEFYGADYDPPEITIYPLTYANQYFYVAGDVSREGEYPLTRQTTVAEGLLQAGFSARPATQRDTGASYTSSDDRGSRARSADPPDLVLLVRRGEGDQGRIVKPIRFKKFLTEGGTDGDITIEARDIIFVPENLKLIYVLGEVNGPGGLRWTPGMRVLDAISDAGHWTEDARASDVSLLRKNPDGTLTTFRLNLWKSIKKGDSENNPFVEPSDTIYVPRNAIAHVEYFFRMFNEGAVRSAMETYQQRLIIEELDNN